MATVTATTTSPRRRNRPRHRGGAAGLAWRLAIVVSALLAGGAVFLPRGSTARGALEEARGLVQKGTPATDARIQALVRGALQRDVTQPAALELTALDDESRGDSQGAARIYALSNRLSRRSLATRVWLVQQAVERGDVPGTLTNMDIALRTSSAAPGLVFPALARGLEDRNLVAPIASLVDRPSEWREMFLIYAADHAEPSSAATLFLALRDRRAIARNELDRQLIVRLVDAGRFALARRLDEAFGGLSSAAGTVADPDFDSPRARYPFGWGLTDTAELRAARDDEGGRPSLAYRANAGEGGQVAAQLLTLLPGSYVLATQAGRSSSEAAPVWTVSCAGPATMIATLEIGSGANVASSTAFAVPAHCPAQWLTLTVRPALVAQTGSVRGVTVTAR